MNESHTLFEMKRLLWLLEQAAASTRELGITKERRFGGRTFIKECNLQATDGEQKK